ncbi:Putative Cell morphogenesis protein [Septoria linicola]|uniref:Cell morphogenesis protein n=1 Tax=Septoria linicola TaxID=215465 RepID=A0A9Q9EMR0_9PEZI|nr:Putative Cell morphogenesis protein [Septoria linicola]
MLSRVEVPILIITVPTTAVPSPVDGLTPISTSISPILYSDPNTSPPPEPLLVAPPTAPFVHPPPNSSTTTVVAAAHSAIHPQHPARDPSVTRGRALSSTSSRNASPRALTPAAPPTRSHVPKQSVDIDRKPSVSYSHHRQASIVHGVQHSRNPSLMASANSSPLSPTKILSATTATSQDPGFPANLKKSPSMSQLGGSLSGGSSPVNAVAVNKSFESIAGQRRPERMHSGRMKRTHEHNRSQSRTHGSGNGSEPKTVGEYALHHLFTSFIAEADEKIERCMQKPGEPEPRIENICGAGADPAFDQLISSLGHINRHKPNSLIDSVIHWRKKKADAANHMYTEVRAMREAAGLTQRTTAGGSTYVSPSSPSGHDVMLDQNVSMADRRSTVSIYILCRVLIEIIGQTTLKALNGPDNTFNTAGRLEDVIYGQLQSADPDLLATSAVIRANWVIRGQLLGVMSGVRFEQVADRFLRDLEAAQRRLGVKGVVDQKLAAKTALLVQSMRWLKVRTQPEAEWMRSCEMLYILAKFFAEVHGRTMKHAYAELFEHLLLPVAATATTELNHPKWKEVVAIIQPKISQMLSKADHWPYVYPLQAVLLSASPAEQFATQWLPLAVNFQPKARDRAGRSHALKALCRLTWRYLYRFADSPNAVVRKLEEIVKLVFQGGKRVLISTDPVIADPLIQLIRIIGFKHQDFCFRTIIFPLMNAELFSGPEKDLKIENLDPEKTVIAIRAFLAIMADLEKGESPPFPTRFECDAFTDPSSRSPLMHRRTRSQGFAVSAGRTERLSRPVTTTNLDDVAKEYYVKFCKMLGQLTIICDNTFGGQAVLDEKFASQTTPKTPMAEAFTFNKRDDFMNPTDLRQHYYDLLHVAVEALPRCLSPHLPINSLVNLLCTGTAHVQSHIATSSAQSLKSIARQSHAQQVTIGFARFIFNFDDRYSTVSDGSLLGPGHIENTLKLYVELLGIWIDDIQQRTRKAVADPNDEEEGARPLPLDLSGVLAHVDEVESHGLFFLCSPSRAVRAVAVNVLRLITKFDTALGKPSTRIISILEGGSQQVIDVNDERLSLAERSRLQKGLRKSNVNGTLVDLCSSDVAHDQNLWFKVFPNLIRLSSEICLHAVALTRELVCQRLSHSYRAIGALAEGQKQSANALEQAFTNGRPNQRLHSTAPEVIIEQWKIHLIFACTTLTNIGGAPNHLPVSSQSSQHTRKSSKSSATSQERIASASELFSRVVPFLSVSNAAVRHAAVTGLGATNATLFQSLLETLQPYVLACSQEAKERMAAHQRTMSTTARRSRRTDFLRTEITHLLSLLAHLLQDPAISGEEYVMHYMTDYTKHLRIFLSDTEIQGELEFQKLRMYFCILAEGLYDCIRKLREGSQWMSFQARQATFSLMENWCGFSPNELQLRRQQDHVRRSILEREGDMRSRGIINSAIEKEKNELSAAALSSMASLCAGPLRFVADGKVLMQFDIRRMLSWISAIFEAPSDRTHALGRKALQNLIVHNTDQPALMAQTMRMCYVARGSKALASYFEVVTRVLTDNANVATPFWKILCAGLYTLGNENNEIRMKSVRLLRALEERLQKTSKLQDLDISVSDKTTAVYKLAQFEISCRLASQHPELAFHVFSEFSAYFNELQPDHQRNMVSGMLPWIQAIELQLDPNGGPTGTSYMLLVNLFEITVKTGITLHNEMQALWQALATGHYAGNVQLVLDFIIGICLDKKEQNFVIYAKQIVVFLSKTPAGARVVEYLLMQICPKNMVAERREPTQAPLETPHLQLPYVADLSQVLPSGAKQNGLSLGQLSMILLVDLVVSPFQLPADKVPTLLQIILVQWDQYVSIVQDQARELLVHLIHELVISKIDSNATEPEKKSIEDFIESVRRQDPKIAWSYTDSEVRAGEEGSRAVSEPMSYVVDEVVRIFSITYPGIREEMGKVTMNWATSCAVRHVACRSFQVFRCVSTTLDQQMLADMLARLSNTIADDENHDYLIFSLEILTTLRSIIAALEPLSLLQYPQLFWTTCAGLDTIFEREFQEGLSMLDLLLKKMDLSDPAVLNILKGSRPEKWEGGFQGIHALIYKGVRSSNSMTRALQIMEKLVKIPSNDIVGSDDRLLFTMLANLPRYLHHLEDESDNACRESANILAFAAESQNYINLARVLTAFAEGKYKTGKDFLLQCVQALRTSFFPAHEFSSLVFLLGMVNNATPWFKVKTMQVLNIMIPDVDMRKPEIASQGPDLISPLLRLLQTEHCQQALGVLDNVIDMTGTPLDNKHLRMSMAGSHSSRATRKEYDSTKSLYGIPEESGWSIPMPAVHSQQTRTNVHAVFYTLAYAGMNGAQDSEAHSTPEIEFDKEEYQESYFGDGRTSTMMSDDTRGADTNIGELAEKLDTLDDFFDDGESPQPLLNGHSMAHYPVDEREHLYDQQALPILHRSLKRNASITSFQTGFAELRYQPPQPAIMNPAAFAHSAHRTPPQRPGLHNRSITSPAVTNKTPVRAPYEIMSDNEADVEPFSDGDEESGISRANTNDQHYQPSQYTTKPAGGSGGFKALKSGLRRLTSSGTNHKEVREQIRAAASTKGGNPKMPKMPASYAMFERATTTQGPFSAEP